MNYLKKMLLPLFSVMFLLSFSPLASADNNPFGLDDLKASQIQLAGSHGKCGEGKCGEGKCGGSKSSGKCGEGKCGEGKCGGSKSSGKCGEGKCGEGKCGGSR